MPSYLDEVRRAFDERPIAGTRNGTHGDIGTAGSGNASDGDGTSDVASTRAVISSSDSDRTVSPAAAAAKPDDGKRARTAPDRVAGSSIGKRAAARADDPEAASNIEALLFSIHCLLAEHTELNALNLPPAKAKSIAEAINRVNSFYGKKKGGMIPPVTYAWINLLIATGGTYLPMIRAAQKEAKSKTVQELVP